MTRSIDSPEPVVYIIGGLPRTGKTTLSDTLARERNISNFETDHLRAMFDADPTSAIGYNSGAKIKTVTKALRPYLERLIDCHVSSDLACVLNGEAIHPAMIGESPHADRIRTCFLGISDARKSFNDIREHAGERDWTRDQSDEGLLRILKKYVRRSGELQSLCTEWDIPYFDASPDFEAAQEAAFSALAGVASDQLTLAVSSSV